MDGYGIRSESVTTMNTILMLAQMDEKSLVRIVLRVLIIGIVVGLLWWLIDYCGVPEPFRKVAKVIIAIVAVVFLVNMLLTVV